MVHETRRTMGWGATLDSGFRNYPLVGRWKTHLSPSRKTKRVNTKHHSFEGRGFRITWDITMVFFKVFQRSSARFQVAACMKSTSKWHNWIYFENQELEFRLKKHILLETTFPKGRAWTCDEGSIGYVVFIISLSSPRWTWNCYNTWGGKGYPLIVASPWNAPVFAGLLSAQTHSAHSWGAKGPLVGEMMESFTQIDAKMSITVSLICKESQLNLYTFI